MIRAHMCVFGAREILSAAELGRRRNFITFVSSTPEPDSISNAGRDHKLIIMAKECHKFQSLSLLLFLIASATAMPSEEGTRTTSIIYHLLKIF
jgi:hypothetical protein